MLAIVPLNKTALALLEKYYDEERGTLFPFISQQKYNVNIKKAFKLAGPVFLPGESHGLRSLSDYSPWGHKDSDMTE